MIIENSKENNKSNAIFVNSQSHSGYSQYSKTEVNIPEIKNNKPKMPMKFLIFFHTTILFKVILLKAIPWGCPP